MTPKDEKPDFVLQLLKRIGDEGVCAGCKAIIYWVRHLNGNIAPYDITGQIHFQTCPLADQFRKPRVKRESKL